MALPDPTASLRLPDPELLNAGELRGLLHRCLRLASLPGELLPVLQQQPDTSADLLAECFESCEQVAERERIVELAAGLGPAALEHLERRLFKGSPEEAVRAVGLLARLAPGFLSQYLLPRLARWEHPRQDAAVKAIAFSGSPERARLLESLVEHVHPYVLPIVIDELGSAGQPRSARWLMRLAEGEALQAADLYIRVKAVEALGRIGGREAVPLLERLVTSRRLWHWQQPRELRLCAWQSLAKLEPARARQLAATGLSERELSLMPLDPQPGASRVRQRRYSRVRLAHPLPVCFSWLYGRTRLAAEVLSLGGGFARLLANGAEPGEAPPARISRGTTAEVEFQNLLHRVKATAVVRNVVPAAGPRTAGIGFELVSLDLEARSRIRQLLAVSSSASATPAPQNAGPTP